MSSTLYLVILWTLVDCFDNVRQKFDYDYLSSGDFRTRQNRLLTFNTQDNGDISVELAFNVPFVSIPVKKSLSMAQGAIANINIGAILLAGAMAFGIAVLLPTIFTIIYGATSISDKSFKRYDSQQYWWWTGGIFDRLSPKDIEEIKTCLPEVFCKIFQTLESQDKKGGSTEENIFKAMVNNALFQMAFKDHPMIDVLMKNLSSGCERSNKEVNCEISQVIIDISKNLINNGFKKE